MPYYDYENLINTTTPMIGRTFGKLKVISRGADFVEDSGRHIPTWNCECTCENHTLVNNVKGIMLRQGNKTSCGCRSHLYGDEHPNYKHGASKSRLYNVYGAMITRCENPNSSHYKFYGGKGVSVCPEWRNDFRTFSKWMYDHGYDDNAPQGMYTIDRIDPNGNYCPENCRLSDNKSQCNNKTNNHILTFNGKSQSISMWSDETGIPVSTIANRLKRGWDTDRILSTPKQEIQRFEMDGNYYTAVELSTIYGVEHSSLCRLLAKGYPAYKAIPLAKSMEGSKITRYVNFSGSTAPIGTFVRVLDLEYKTAVRRYNLIKEGQDLDLVFRRPITGRPINAIFFEKDGRYYTESEWPY